MNEKVMKNRAYDAKINYINNIIISWSKFLQYYINLDLKKKMIIRKKKQKNRS